MYCHSGDTSFKEGMILSKQPTQTLLISIITRGMCDRQVRTTHEMHVLVKCVIGYMLGSLHRADANTSTFICVATEKTDRRLNDCCLCCVALSRHWVHESRRHHHDKHFLIGAPSCRQQRGAIVVAGESQEVFQRNTIIRIRPRIARTQTPRSA